MTDSIDKLWVVIGRPLKRPKPYDPPEYSTDPRQYELLGVKPLSDEEFAQIAGHVRAFRELEDAVRFAFTCDWETVSCTGYRRIGGVWFMDAEVWQEFMDETP